MQILLLSGLILILGLAAGRLFEKIGIPQVVGYLVMGVPGLLCFGYWSSRNPHELLVQFVR